jgi:hypothetical protein
MSTPSTDKIPDLITANQERIFADIFSRRTPGKVNSPFREDKDPSVSISEKDGRLLWHDFINDDGHQLSTCGNNAYCWR